MIDLRNSIIPKSDQLNADDLIGKNITIKITKVELAAGEQPIKVHYENENGKPWMPGKSMRRVLVQVWGSDGAAYVGRSLTLYRDDKVLFGGVAVGGIRISHMSHIKEAVTMALTVTRANRKPFTVQPLTVARTAAPDPEAMAAIEQRAGMAAKQGSVALGEFWGELTPENRKHFATAKEGWKTIAAAADAQAAALPSDDDAKAPIEI